ncbi:DNA-binding transcriptional regulator KdgR [Celeribacter halophilus]|uniref:DNA-binding transcriptional regulator KdgR n=1 Tax=Celeribacter halophilus TaxID=576117 RepID=A0AAW7Y0D2_9RHOB|nr:IclR family transcriptional regulator C-terminal domain-containing protein [Celeribacter halophilus]MDO6458514.1 DNA-binding transcriptional regulator KdgR [Celeribacter halophilus]MDO6725010.1 DNA-binding transcriptional regulator KdgR [Celeribacter halophilus]
MPSPTKPDKKPENVASVLKVFSVLETLSEEGSAPLARIAQKAMTSKATTHRLLQTMRDLGYVEQQAQSEEYRLTLKLFSLSARALEGQDRLLKATESGMARLSQETGEAINLGVIDETGQDVVYIRQIESSYALSLKCTVGSRNRLYCTALGKALLAWRNAAEVDACLQKMSFAPVGPQTLADASAFRNDLAQTKAQGFAEEIEESEAGVRCMAVPVRDQAGQSVAAVSIAFPLFRYDAAHREDYIALLTQVGREASEALGYRSEPAQTGPAIIPKV